MGKRLSVVHEQLVSAQTDAERIAQQAKLSELVEAYEFVTGGGIHTRGSDDASATQMRSDAEATVLAETLVRMEPGLCLGVGWRSVGCWARAAWVMCTPHGIV